MISFHSPQFKYMNFHIFTCKRTFVSTANKPLVGTLMTIGDVTVSIAISDSLNSVRARVIDLFITIEYRRGNSTPRPARKSEQLPYWLAFPLRNSAAVKCQAKILNCRLQHASVGRKESHRQIIHSILRPLRREI